MKLVLLLAFLFPAISFGQLVTGPDTVESGQAIQLHYDAEPGDVVRWTVLNPWPSPVMLEIRSEFGTDFVIDPPCGWIGAIRVQCIATGSDDRVKAIETKAIEVVKANTPTPVDPTPVDPVEPPIDPPSDEYDGPNEWGLGSISYNNAPSHSAAVVDTFNRAAEYLKGRPSLKVLYTDDPVKNRTDYNVNVWTKNQMQSHSATSDWVAWYNAVYARMQELNQQGLTLDQWYSAFNEVAAGVEAKK